MSSLRVHHGLVDEDREMDHLDRWTVSIMDGGCMRGAINVDNVKWKSAEWESSFHNRIRWRIMGVHHLKGIVRCGTPNIHPPHWQPSNQSNHHWPTKRFHVVSGLSPNSKMMLSQLVGIFFFFCFFSVVDSQGIVVAEDAFLASTSFSCSFCVLDWEQLGCY